MTVSALRKGRSSKHSILRRVRAMAATILANDVVFYCNWIPTEVNPADGPSRRYKFDSTLGFPGEGPRFLQLAALAPSTQNKYHDAVDKFLVWVDNNLFDADSAEQLDECLSEYFHFLYLSKAGAYRSLAEATIAGISIQLPHIKNQLYSSRLALRKRLVPSVSYIAVQLVCDGHWSKGVGTLLSFDCYLRVSELVGLCRSDLALPNDRRLGSTSSGMALRLRTTKTGSNQWVSIRSSDVMHFIHILLSRIPQDDDARLFNFSSSTFRKHSRRHVTTCNFPKTTLYTPFAMGGRLTTICGACHWRTFFDMDDGPPPNRPDTISKLADRCYFQLRFRTQFTSWPCRWSPTSGNLLR